MERYQRVHYFGTLKEAVRSWNELRFLAGDRQKWKGLIDNLCS